MSTQEINYDESKVPEYTLPDPLIAADGTKITETEAWRQHRRSEILRPFKEHVYGYAPGRPEGMTFETTSLDKELLILAMAGVGLKITFSRMMRQGPKAFLVGSIVFLLQIGFGLSFLVMCY